MNLRFSSTTLRVLSATTVALALGANAQAAKEPERAYDHPEHYTRTFNTCVERAMAFPKFEVVLSALFPCYQAETAIQDRVLNIYYKKAMLAKKPDDQTALRLYERAWIEERDNTCNALGDKEVLGTRHLITVFYARDCTLQWTMQRAEQLEGK